MSITAFKKDSEQANAKADTQVDPAFVNVDLDAYQRDGYVIISGLFDADEVQIMRKNAEQDMPGFDDVLKKQDQAGNNVNLKMWAHAGDDIYGMFSRNERMVNEAERVIRGEVYLYSAKMILKDAHDGGAWEWHQDYGYWYNNGCLTPNMSSCIIAVDENTVENGCLQVLRGSHHIGRIDHVRVNEQFIAEQERVKVALERFERVYVPLKPGDAILFHSNLLHASDANTSDRRRWNFIASYNAADNRPFKQMRSYGHDEALVKVPRQAIRDFAAGK